MTSVFLCGPLGHAALSAVVLGQQAETRPAQLQGYALRPVCGGAMAGLVPQGGAEVAGHLVDGLPGAALERLRYYLAVFGLSLRDGPLGAMPVADHPDQADQAEQADWSPADWTDLQALQTARAAEEIIAHRQTYSPAEMARRLGPIRMRAQYWARAQTEPAAPAGQTDPARDPAHDVIVHARHFPYLNYFSAQEMDLQFRRYDGSLSPVVNRGALMMGEAAVVLPYDPVQDNVLLIEQFRAPLFMGGSRTPWMWEAVAGMIDPGETAEIAARREAMEEAGVTLTRLHPVGPVHSSSGTLSDRLHLFVGLADLTQRQDATGLASEGEDIRSQVLDYDAFLQGIDAQHYSNLPLLAIALWLARHRDRLRAANPMLG